MSVDYRALFQLSPNPYMVLDRQLRYVTANGAYLRETGSTLDELVGRCIFDVFPNDPANPLNEPARRLRASFEKVLATRAPDHLPLIPYRVPRSGKSGTVTEEEVWSATHTPVLDEHGEVAFILQHTVNVTPLDEGHAATALPPRQMEEGVLRRAQWVQEVNRSLDAERQHLRRLFDQAPGFTAFLRGPAHVFEMANRAYLQLIGDREIIGKPVREVLREVEGQGLFELLDRVYGSAEPYVGRSVRVLLSREPGQGLEEFFLDFVYQPILGPDGTVTGIFVQGNDITEQKRAEVELARYREHLEELVRERTRALEESEAERREAEAALFQAQKMEAVGNLTGGVAHDFNNLLQVISGNVQLLRRDGPPDERSQRRLQAVEGAIERGARLASQLLAFARRQPLQPVVLDLGLLVHEMDDLLRRAIGEDVRLETRAHADLWNTLADPNQLENVILNLAINARDAMEGTGTLTIGMENVPMEEGPGPGAWVLLTISDTGAGMTPEVMARAFEPFFTTKPEGRGTGLGLSMVYGFVKQSGGHVAIESTVGGGTTIRIWLQRAGEQVSPREAERARRSEGGNETILVVEDDPQVRAVAVETIAGLGYRVIEASDGAGALAALGDGARVDLLFTDVVMPGPVRGPELARRARELAPDLEVLFTSGYTESALESGGRIPGNCSLLSKPWRREDLAARLRQLLGRRSRVR